MFVGMLLSASITNRSSRAVFLCYTIPFMPHETMLTTTELDQFGDLSGSTLYSAEVKRIPFLTSDEQKACIEAASAGDENARHELVINCLNWTMTKAARIYQDREPAHSDLMDLVGHAHVKLLEALPKALYANDPLRYLMSVSALEMRLYCSYDDPLVKRPRSKPRQADHPATVSIEAGVQPPLDTLAARAEQPAVTDEATVQLVYDALSGLSDRRREIITAAFGLFDNPTLHIADIALMLNVPKKTVENYLYRTKRELARKLAPPLPKA